MSVWMIENHPIQNAYFSLPARYVQHNFELDYWGLSFRPALEYLLRDQTYYQSQVEMQQRSSSDWAIMDGKCTERVVRVIEELANKRE